MGRSGGLVHPQAASRGLDFGIWWLVKRGLQLVSVSAERAGRFLTCH
jgi:hypothetical protein